jgi:hypothetical protein
MKPIFDAENRRVEFLDERFYVSDDGNSFYPSVTRVLDYLPKNPMFYTWMKDVGHNAKHIAQRAADEGTNVHDAMEVLLAGNEVHWEDDNGKARYNQTEWNCIRKGHQFLKEYNPEVLWIEARLVSDKLKTGGTADLICKMGDENWLIDWKTSNNLSPQYMVQLAIYAKMIEEKLGITIHNAGVLWLKAKTKGPDKKGFPKLKARLKKQTDEEWSDQQKEHKKAVRKWYNDKLSRKIQGKGWQFVPVTYKKQGLDLEKREAWVKYLDLWKAVKYIYDFENEGDKPKNLVYDTTLKL